MKRGPPMEPPSGAPTSRTLRTLSACVHRYTCPVAFLHCGVYRRHALSRAADSDGFSAPWDYRPPLTATITKRPASQVYSSRWILQLLDIHMASRQLSADMPVHTKRGAAGPPHALRFGHSAAPYKYEAGGSCKCPALSTKRQHCDLVSGSVVALNVQRPCQAATTWLSKWCTSSSEYALHMRISRVMPRPFVGVAGVLAGLLPVAYYCS